MIYHVTRTNLLHDEKPCPMAIPTWTYIVHRQPKNWIYSEQEWLSLGKNHCEINGRKFRTLGRVKVWAVDLDGDDSLIQFEQDHGECAVSISPFDLVTPLIEIVDYSEPPPLAYSAALDFEMDQASDF